MKEKVITETEQTYYEYKDKINDLLLRQYIEETRGRTPKGNISCIYAESEPAHKNGKDKKPSMGFMEGSNKLHCFTCDRVAGLYDIVKYDKHFNTDLEVYNYLKEKYPNIPKYNGNNDNLGQNRTPSPVQQIQEIANVEINTEYNFTDIIDIANNNVLINNQKESYIGKVIYDYFTKKRGLSEEIIKRFKLGAVNNFNDIVCKYENLKTTSKKSQYYKIVLPLLDEGGNCYNFIAEICNREMIDTYNQKYKKPSTSTGLTTMIFNEYYLKNDKPSNIFITEGIYDSLSIEQLGYKSIALMGIGSNRLISLIKHYKPNTNFIVLLDNDEAGKTNANNLIAELKALNMQNIKVINGIDILQDYQNISACKDPNEMLLKDSKELKTFLKANVKIINSNEDSERIDSANVYTALDYFRNITDQPPAQIISTCFSQLDSNLKGGLRTGLYVLGALSSLGKTAFMLQLADQIAENGTPVLYFSLEMDKKELMARSIARTSFKYIRTQKDRAGNPLACTIYDILDNTRYKDYSKEKLNVINYSINMYEKTAKNLYIISGRYKKGDIQKRYDINDIEKTIKDFILYTEKKPIIFIDYMQIIAPIDLHYTDKQNMDEIVDRLKQISMDIDTPVIAISSYNRDNYYEPANVSAFKESGAIEYGADYILALQYQGIDEIYYGTKINGKGNRVSLYNSEADKKRAVYDLIEDYKQKSNQGENIPIELKLLKVRNCSKFNMVFNLNYTYGYFMEQVKKESEPKKQVAKML